MARRFMMTCRECDDGYHLNSKKEALAEGWTEIVPDSPDHDGFGWTHTGLCKECHEFYEQEDKAKQGILFA